MRRRSAICPNESLNTEDCASYKWSAVSAFSYIGVNITEYILFKNINMSMKDIDHWNKEINIR